MSDQEDFVTSLKWLPHFIHEQEEPGICVRLEFQSRQGVDGNLVETIRQKIEEGVWHGSKA